jgi:hypothetical protein
MLEDAQHFTIRLEGNTWQVNVPGEDWIDANSLRDAETIAAAPLLMREVTSARRDGEGTATECEQKARVLEKYDLHSGATFLRKHAENIRAGSGHFGDTSGDTSP